VADTTAAQDAFPDPDSLIDRELILKWLYSGLFWLVVTPSIGVTISSLFNYPDYLGTSQYLTFGRLRPLHINGVIWGAFSTLFIGLCYYIVPRLAGVPKLYIMGSDEPQLAQSTSELFRGSPEPREQVLLAHGNYVGMRDDEKRIYENRIASFFLLNLPPSGRPRR